MLIIQNVAHVAHVNWSLQPKYTLSLPKFTKMCFGEFWKGLVLFWSNFSIFSYKKEEENHIIYLSKNGC
jgi:hypothetical protein